MTHPPSRSQFLEIAAAGMALGMGMMTVPQGFALVRPQVRQNEPRFVVTSLPAGHQRAIESSPGRPHHVLAIAARSSKRMP